MSILRLLSTSEVIARLQQLAVPYKIGKSSTALRQRLKELSCKHHIKVWRDHSSISSHGHLLVLVSIIYDPAFFYTSEEMKELKGVEIDVPTVVGKPETYILGRSTSSTVDQLHNKKRMLAGDRAEITHKNWSSYV